MALEFPTRILVATDGSEASLEALATACQLAQATESELHLVYVVLTSSTIRGRPMTPTQREALEEEGSQVLDDAARRARGNGCEIAAEHLRFGTRLDLALLRVQEDLEAGLLVIGARSGTSLAQRLLGSEGGAGVTRRSPRSVLLVRSGD
jgi:universal stress protein A